MLLVSHCETDDKQRSLLTSQDYVLDTFNQIQVQSNLSTVDYRALCIYCE